MKISIDTKEDSHEEIRKIIKMLQSLVGENSYSNQPNIFADNPPSQTNANSGLSVFGAMFGDDSPVNKVEPSQASSIIIPSDKATNDEYEETAELEVY